MRESLCDGETVEQQRGDIRLVHTDDCQRNSWHTKGELALGKAWYVVGVHRRGRWPAFLCR